MSDFFQCFSFSHYREVVSLGEEAHLNTSFKHFIYFVQVSWKSLLFITRNACVFCAFVCPSISVCKRDSHFLLGISIDWKEGARSVARVNWSSYCIEFRALMMSEMLHFIFLGEVFRGLSIYSFRDNIDVEKNQR